MLRSRDSWLVWPGEWVSAAVCAAALAGCSSTRLAMQGDTPPKLGAPPETAAVSVPGSPEFGAPRELKRPEKVHVAYGRWQEQQRQPALAREAYQKALDHDPKSVEALLGLARLDQLAGRPEEAARHLQRAQQLHPQEPLVYAGWGEFYASQQDWSQAIERYRQAIRLAPDEPLFKHQLGVAQVKSGAVQEGLASFASAVGEAEAYYNVGVLLYQLGRVPEAEQYLQRALSLKPELTPASKMLAKIQQQRGVGPAVASRLGAQTAPVVPGRSSTPASPPVITAGTTAPVPAIPPPAAIPLPPLPAPSSVPATSAATAQGAAAAQPGANAGWVAPTRAPVPSGWTAARPSDVQPASFTPPPATSPQQEQWQNQQ